MLVKNVSLIIIKTSQVKKKVSKILNCSFFYSNIITLYNNLFIIVNKIKYHSAKGGNVSRSKGILLCTRRLIKKIKMSRPISFNHPPGTYEGFRKTYCWVFGVRNSCYTRYINEFIFKKYGYNIFTSIELEVTIFSLT